ncbi:unnamed protein product [Caenorhabditis bovis]|uniref:Complex 1 LYR protein domain-containing protein n=1 Tax=Caenorhabditis bovis TaxID=2654633 RepID=A0A8S1EVR9_9PELO|nr:unnamed protein product [Caenorhabditis bovis]
MSNRKKVLDLYRQILKLGKNWKAKDESRTALERQEILAEARSKFREFQKETDQIAIGKLIYRAEQRIVQAEHYGIPYERPEYLPPETAYNVHSVKQNFQRMSRKRKTE